LQAEHAASVPREFERENPLFSSGVRDGTPINVKRTIAVANDNETVVVRNGAPFDNYY